MDFFQLTRSQFNDVYIGELTSLADPLRLGRVQVRVFGMTDNLPEESLPWAELHLPLGAGTNRGNLPAMAVGDRVQIRYAQGDGRYPVVVGSALTATNREVQLPAIGVDGPRSNAGVRTTPPELPTSQSAGVPYLSDEVSLQHNILIQRRSNRSYRIAHMLQGSQFEMTSTGAIALHSPQAIWFSTPAELQERFHTRDSKGTVQTTELLGKSRLEASHVEIEAVSAVTLDAGGTLSMGGLKTSITSLDGVSILSGSGISMVSTQSFEVLATTGAQIKVATNDLEMETVLGSVSLKATPIGPSIELSPLSGVTIASPLAKLEADLLGNVTLSNPTVSFTQDVTGAFELKNPLVSLSATVAGEVELKNQMAQISLGVSGRIKVSNQADNLGSILKDLLQAILNLDVQTGVGKSSKPVNIVEFQAIARRLQMLLE